jgi:hypothetical protein
LLKGGAPQLLIGYFYFGAIFVVLVLLAVDMVRTNSKRISALKSQFGAPPKDHNINFESVNAFHRVFPSKSSHIIDDTTWNDLEMDRIFERLDTCCSSIGEEYLYAVLRTPEIEPDILLARESLIQFLDQNQDARFALQIALLNIGKEPNSGLAQLLFKDAPARLIQPEALYWLLAALPILSALLLLVSINLGVACILVFSFINCIVYIRNK